MVKVLTVSDIRKMIEMLGIKSFFSELISALEDDFSRWQAFQKSPRHVTHVENGVMELMPACDDQYYTFKFVNGHPDNPKQNKQTVVAFGCLAEVAGGYPLLLSEMTVLTALRTAATSALAAKYLARKNTNKLGIIGTGAQSEFQIMALASVFDIQSVKYFDIDPKAMQKFCQNLKDENFELIACQDIKSTVKNVDVITTATAMRKHASLLDHDSIYPGLHINSIGGDSPGKTELHRDLLDRTKIVVEYLPQSMLEGEIQQFGGIANVYAELWEIVSGDKKGRELSDEITLFDSVGFAVEDYATLRCVSALAKQLQLGTAVELIPSVKDPRNLYGVLNADC